VANKELINWASYSKVLYRTVMIVWSNQVAVILSMLEENKNGAEHCDVPEARTEPSS
jgi:hypothetical protein